MMIDIRRDCDMMMVLVALILACALLSPMQDDENRHCDGLNRPSGPFIKERYCDNANARLLGSRQLYGKADATGPHGRTICQL